MSDSQLPARRFADTAGRAIYRMRALMIPINELSTSGTGRFDCGQMGESVEAKYWHKRADEARSLADDMKDEISKQMTLQIADDYEHLARRAKQRAKL